ncbi:flagellar basal-body rod protein FlgB [Alkalibacterium subtropicum]|uniref:Flagellar basal body rod protein FlgB n=1 Tax=Alkalibacterium subtropicum TaxID=753702 RepID=A0A1I1J062_9LACT|nr:flagellar basal body rod protein FlgB [Alkalibacterium subtropicum]SFC40038.1 flagellar basal-body rod protein FlgB [Alkalibacterium subtropicum]
MLTGQNIHLLKNALDASSMRQEAISTNISNVNTAGYKAKRVDFEQALQSAMNGTGLKANHVKHFGANGFGDVKPQTIEQTGNRVNENGNNVAIDTEMAELSANAIYFQAVSTQLTNQYGMIRSVLR